MRIPRFTVPQVIALALALLALGLVPLARGDEEAGDADETEKLIEALEVKAEMLEGQVAYLLSREQDLTAYVTRNAERGQALVSMVARMRQQGFQNRSIPAPSRETLLTGLEALGQDLVKDVPKVTREQGAMLRAAARGQ